MSKPGKQIYYNSKEKLFNFYKDIADFWNELWQKHNKYFNTQQETSIEKINEHINAPIANINFIFMSVDEGYDKTNMLEVYRDKS